MKSTPKILLSLSIISLVLLPTDSSFAATIKVNWISEDTSRVTFEFEGEEKILLPIKGGGTARVGCGTGGSCKLTIADFKDKKGNITYENNLSGLQNISGNINSGTGRFAITTTGDLEGLFNNVVVSGNLIASTGLEATIGTPGNQLLQGGDISFSTQWFSDEAIGIDPITGDEIILGNFFLDSINPLTAFDYTVTNPDMALISSTFTIGQEYTFSTGLEITGTVTKELITVVPEPTSTFSLLALSLGAGLTLLRKKKHRSVINKASSKKYL